MTNKELETVLVELKDQSKGQPLKLKNGQTIYIKQIKNMGYMGPRVYYTVQGKKNKNGTDTVFTLQGFSFLKQLTKVNHD